MTDGQQRFVPSGVNAQSWLGFEQRIQERRFRALLETMQGAIDAGDAVEARIALEEARELRPDAAELSDIEDRLADIPAALLPEPRSVSWSRALGGVFLLLVGIGLLIGLEWMREPVTVPDLAPLSAIHPALPAAFTQPAGVSEPMIALGDSRPAERREYATTVPVATSGTVRYRAARVPVGETPDDYVAPRSTLGTVTTARSLGPAPLLSVAPTQTTEPVLFFDDETLKPALTTHR